ncbi:fused MFS/spermidine synthase [Balneolaceae bacterium ANBcel3]|nr:fused MFS/spermidine synthase [Balneolaceae bacterium ANBcel3]
MKQRFRIAIIILGISGLLAEIILLRELLIVFSGNELSIGLILANWLILEAIGCLFPGYIADRTPHRIRYFATFTIAFSLLLVAAVFATRILKVILGVSIGEHVGLWPMFYSSFLILMPVSILHGALFTFSCRIYASFTEKNHSAAARVYVLETIGTMAGGLLFTFLLIPRVHSFEAVVGLAWINLMICLLLFSPPLKSRRQAILSSLGMFLVLSAGLFFLMRPAERLHYVSIQKQWKNHEVVHYQNSPYGNMTVIDNQGQYLFFLDGIPELITPVPDMLFVEEFVHIPMLAHPDPNEILVVRGGAGGVIHEILQHPQVVSVEYAEHDPAFINLIRAFPTDLTDRELEDERVIVHEIDGRRLLSATDSLYDVVFIGIHEPSNVQSNRFFTTEFFNMAKERLKENGLLAFALPGSMTLQSRELKNLNSSLYVTIREVFPYVRVLPGEQKNLFLASTAQESILLDMDRLIYRLDEREIDASGLVPWHIERKLHAGWEQWFEDFIEGGSQRINRDMRPSGVFYHLSFWNSLYAPGFGAMYQKVEFLSIWHSMTALLMVVILYVWLRRKKVLSGAFAVPCAIGTTGFSGMMFSIIILYMFQTLIGHIFSWIGFLVALFMAGTAIGALLVMRILNISKRSFIGLEAGVLLFAVFLPPVFVMASALADTDYTIRALFLTLSFISGVLVGAQYPMANGLMLKNKEELGRTAGSVYALDLAGGWIGGIAGAVLLIPVLGVPLTCMFIVALKFSSMLFVYMEPENVINQSRHGT